MADTLPAEFAMIARHLRPLAGKGALDLLDDAAVLDVPSGESLVVAADALVQGVHALPDDAPALLARKLLRRNLSDLAAMGARPLGYVMTLAVPRGTPDAWFADFARGLALDQAEFGVSLLGGDTTSINGPVALSLTILGTVPRGTALSRRGAQPGDLLCVSGTIGDGALGLLAARGDIDDPDGSLADRYRLPRPRLALGQSLRGIARAVIDVSDGLLQDVGHLCRAGGLAATIEVAKVPLSSAARRASDMTLCLTGGDDYELAFALPPDREVPQGCACIGGFVAGPPGLTVLDPTGRALHFARGGWSHLGA